MRTALATIIAAIGALGIVLALRAGSPASVPAPGGALAGSALAGSALADSGLAGSATAGRFRIAVVGSRGAQRFGTALRIDTATGKAWRAIVRYGLNDGWVEIPEPEGKGPEESDAPGRFDLSVDLISDTLGQEAAIAGRIDTRTGRSWFLQPLPEPPRWVPIGEPTNGDGDGQGGRR